MYFACNVCFGSLPLFVPTIVSEMGDFTEQQSNGLSAPPYLLTFIVIILCSLLSDHLRLRGPFVCIPAILSCVGYILLATQTEVAPRYAGVFFSILIFVSISILLPWVATVHSTESKRAGGWAIFATLGQLGPLVGTNIFPKDQGPYYAKGAWISCGFVIIVATLSATFSMLLRWENKRLDRNFRTREGTEGGGERGFRYIL